MPSFFLEPPFVESNNFNSIDYDFDNFSWIVVFGEPDNEYLNALMASQKDILFIVDNDFSFKFLERYIKQYPKGNKKVIDQIISRHISEISWFVYNDPRKNGIHSLDKYIDEYPNLILLDTKKGIKLPLKSFKKLGLRNKGNGLILIEKGNYQEILIQVDLLKKKSIL